MKSAPSLFHSSEGTRLGWPRCGLDSPSWSPDRYLHGPSRPSCKAPRRTPPRSVAALTRSQDWQRLTNHLSRGHVTRSKFPLWSPVDAYLPASCSHPDPTAACSADNRMPGPPSPECVFELNHSSCPISPECVRETHVNCTDSRQISVTSESH